jgi:hypothetical protein
MAAHSTDVEEGPAAYLEAAISAVSSFSGSTFLFRNQPHGSAVLVAVNAIDNRNGREHIPR